MTGEKTQQSFAPNGGRMIYAAPASVDVHKAGGARGKGAERPALI